MHLVQLSYFFIHLLMQALGYMSCSASSISKQEVFLLFHCDRCQRIA